MAYVCLVPAFVAFASILFGLGLTIGRSRPVPQMQRVARDGIGYPALPLPPVKR